MVVAQKRQKPAPWDFLRLFIIKFSSIFENFIVIEFMGFDSWSKNLQKYSIKKGYLALLIFPLKIPLNKLKNDW